MLLALLYARWQAGGSGVTVLPCELVQHNGAKLHAIVGELARASDGPPAFMAWLDTQCRWVNTLVDRIVSTALEPVGAIAEPYALWAIEDQPGLTLPFAHPAITLTADLERFERLKLHILNLGHTWLAERWARHGAPADLTVRESLADPTTRAAFDTLFAEEVIPGFARHGMELEAQAYLATTIERFANPFLDHRIADIHAGHAAKVAKRVSAFMTWVDSAGGAQPPPALPRLRDVARAHADGAYARH
jgi:tagaturonate reductase